MPLSWSNILAFAINTIKSTFEWQQLTLTVRNFKIVHDHTHYHDPNRTFPIQQAASKDYQQLKG